MQKPIEKSTLIAMMYRLYIKLVTSTSSIKIEGTCQTEVITKSIVGFWHQDSFGMNFLMQTYRDIPHQMHAIATASKRGDYIHALLKGYGVKTVRLPDGAAIRHFLEQLKEDVKAEDYGMCIALDGPLGPYKEPKKLAPMLAKEGDKDFIVVKVDYTRHIKLTKRWDQYSVPFPFGNITFKLMTLGRYLKKSLKRLKCIKKK